MNVQQQQRGRSPSVGHNPDRRIRHSPSPQPFRDTTSPPNLNPSSPYTSGLSPLSGNAGQYSAASPFLNAPGAQQQQQQFSQHVLPGSDFNNPNLNQSFQQDEASPGAQHQSTQLNQQFQPDLLNANAPQNNNQKTGQFDNAFLLDPQLQGNSQQQDQSVNPVELMSNMSSPQTMHPTPPSLMPPHAQSSEPTSPFSNPGQHWSPNHSRQASLDPSSAFLNGQQNDWATLIQGAQFQLHRRTPSEHSDVSSSVAPSPYLAQNEAFDNYDQSHSPMMAPQPGSQNFTDGLNIEAFNISDNPQRRPSPGHSPFVSPMMSPHPGMGPVQDHAFSPLPEAKHGFANAQGMKAMPSQAEQFPQFPGHGEYGQADQIPPPEINVEFAPNPQRGPLDAPRFEGDFGALSPPDRSRRGRIRAKSDTFVSRPTTPSSTVSTLGSNDFGPEQRSRSGSLSPNDVGQFSRESSPGARSPSQVRRSSMSSVPNSRDYILDLADPSRPSNTGTEKRVQKHPATFQCSLCPKKFTRAYNLRSHLRTHTDERPFVCNVCSKAFARQHDRKRHEGLHSGEKKFVCRGELGNGTNWGCGRRFARADALGRHFRSEAGRVCIKPLLDEEAMERQRSMDEHMINHNMQMGGLSPAAAMNGVNFTLPAALLAQYPALQGIQWEQLSVGPDEGDISGRSSFDASSGGDYYDDEDEGSGYVSDNPVNPGFETGGIWQGGSGWRSDME